MAAGVRERRAGHTWGCMVNKLVSVTGRHCWSPSHVGHLPDGQCGATKTQHPSVGREDMFICRLLSISSFSLVHLTPGGLNALTPPTSHSGFCHHACLGSLEKPDPMPGCEALHLNSAEGRGDKDFGR